MRPKKGDRITFKHKRLVRKGTVLAVAKTGVHYLVKSGIFNYRIPLSQVVRIVDEQEVK